MTMSDISISKVSRVLAHYSFSGKSAFKGISLCCGKIF